MHSTTERADYLAAKEQNSRVKGSSRSTPHGIEMPNRVSVSMSMRPVWEMPSAR